MHKMLIDAIKVINVMKSRSLNAQQFHRLCKSTSSEHAKLLLHAELLVFYQNTDLLLSFF